MASGVFLGRGFRWTAHHTRALVEVLDRDGALPVDSGLRGGHPALYAIGQQEEVPVVLPWSEMEAQTGLQGTNRSGKTTELELMSVQAIHADGACVMIDPKGSRKWLARCAVEATKAGKRFVLVTPILPHLSATMNVLSTATIPQEMVPRIQALMPVSDDPFFTNYPLAFTEHIAAAQQALGIPWTLEGLEQACVVESHTKDLLSQYLASLGCAGKNLA